MQSMLKLLAVCEKNADYTLKKGMFFLLCHREQREESVNAK